MAKEERDAIKEEEALEFEREREREVMRGNAARGEAEYGHKQFENEEELPEIKVGFAFVRGEDNNEAIAGKGSSRNTSTQW